MRSSRADIAAPSVPTSPCAQARCHVARTRDYRGRVTDEQDTGEGKPAVGSSKPPPVDPAEIGVFIDQARWLLDYHDRRSESLSTRAVALLGFAGVVFALVLQGRLPKGVDSNCVIAIAIVVTLGGVLAAAGCCVYVLMTREITAPGVGQLRGNWHEWAGNVRRGSAAVDVAESLLRGKALGKASPINSVIDAADRRACAFTWAVRALAVSLVSLTVVLVAVGLQL